MPNDTASEQRLPCPYCKATFGSKYAQKQHLARYKELGGKCPINGGRGTIRKHTYLEDLQVAGLVRGKSQNLVCKFDTEWT